MKTIAFYQPHLDIQGTGVSNYDYAHFNQVILGNKSYMICDKDCKHTHPLFSLIFLDSSCTKHSSLPIVSIESKYFQLYIT